MSLSRDAKDGLGAGAFIVGVIVLILLLLLGVWGFRVLFAPQAGKGDARITRESGVNRLGQQEYFERTHAAIQAQKGVISVQKQALDSGNGDVRTLQTNYTGAVQRCMTMVGEYNAAARTERAEQFRAADLPASYNLEETCR